MGLDPVDEFYRKAREFGIDAFAAGDAEEIAEASAAMFSGKIKGLEIAHALGHNVGEIPPDWYRTAEILKSKPGATVAALPPAESLSCTSAGPRQGTHPARSPSARPAVRRCGQAGSAHRPGRPRRCPGAPAARHPGGS